ncbi:MAG: hypothetical protein SF052_22210 [Bacteroidia bacterium]|nr:hypothetical protein [Bacteroidia bacterium]
MKPLFKLYPALVLALAGLLVSGCSHLEEIEPPGVVPEISLISVSPTVVIAHEEEIIFKIEYTDGDGDLGSNNDLDRNVFVKDTRIDVVHEFRLRQLAPDGAVIPITGIFDIVLPNTIITNGSGEQKAVFSIHIVDRAGNESNVVDSPEITIKAE